MKFQIAADVLRPAVEAAAILAPGTYVRPILETMMVEVSEAGAVTVSATDYTSCSVWFNVPGVESPQPGRACINSANLLRLIKEAGSKKVTISWDEKSVKSKVAFERTRATLPVENPRDYPQIKRFEAEQPFISLPAAVLTGLLERTNFSASDDSKIRSLAGVHWQATPKVLSLASTDGIRMSAVYQDIANPAGYTFDLVTPPLDPKEIVRIATKEGNVDIQARENFLRLRGSVGESLHNTMNCNFPKFDLEKNLTLTKKATFKVAELRDALERAMLLKAKNQTWEFKLEGEALTICAVAGCDGAIDAETAVVWPHEPFAIRLSPTYLLDAVKVVKTETIDLDLESNRQPVRLREVKDGFLFLYALGAQV